MKNSIPYIIILVLVALFLFREGCMKPEVVVVKPRQNTDSIKKQAYKEAEEVFIAKNLVKERDSVRTVYRDRWHKVKADTIHHTKTQIVNSCDSTRLKDSLAIVERDRLNADQDTLINTLWTLHKADSTNSAYKVDSLITANKGLKKEVRKQKFQKWGLLTLWGLREGAGIALRQQQP